MRSPDRIKDQTYFLSGLRQEQLSKAVFPVGDFDKGQVGLVYIHTLPLKTQAHGSVVVSGSSDSCTG
jgi:tRNA U34 2-thiouridine synthase MnmA/TrmU